MRTGHAAILTYHSLDDSGSVISTPPSLFARQMEFLASAGIPVVPLDELPRTPGGVAITFDDGFANLLDHAVPILQTYRFPASIFVVSDYCGRRNNWPSQPAGSVPDLPLLGWEDLAQLPPTISLGAHTVTHPDLSRLSADRCERELRDCRNEIEQRLGKPVRSLAYPYGASSPATRQLAARYFDVAVGTSLRFVPRKAEVFDLPRIDTYYLRGDFSIERLFTTPGALYLRFRCALREARQALQ